MKKRLLLLVAILALASATLCPPDNEVGAECWANCSQEDYCQQAACIQQCSSAFCVEYCEGLACPPGNTDEACWVICDRAQDTGYYTCGSTLLAACLGADSTALDSCLSACEDMDASACEVESCVQACYGQHCPDYCAGVGCPPENHDSACHVACSQTETYQVCAGATGRLLSVAVVTALPLVAFF